ASYRRQRDMAWFPGERAKPVVGVTPQENPHQRIAEVADRVRQVLPFVNACEKGKARSASKQWSESFDHCRNSIWPNDNQSTIALTTSSHESKSLTSISFKSSGSMTTSIR